MVEMLWSRYAYATTLAIVAESMVGTDEPVSFQEPHAQRDAAVQAKIACRGHLPVCQPVEHKTLIKKLCSNRFLCHLMREGYGIPIWTVGSVEPGRYRQRGAWRCATISPPIRNWTCRRPGSTSVRYSTQSSQPKLFLERRRSRVK